MGAGGSVSGCSSGGGVFAIVCEEVPLHRRKGKDLPPTVFVCVSAFSTSFLILAKLMTLLYL